MLLLTLLLGCNTGSVQLPVDTGDTAGPCTASTEVCDGIDNDCDGLIDDADPDREGASTWHEDADGDGYGSSVTSDLACTQPDGWVADATDCDDAHVEAHPGGSEVCDDLDNDCDTLVDGQDDSLAGATTWYVDGDRDGYGDSSTAQAACNQPGGTVSVEGDCDDGDASVNPNEREVCNDIDDDCDGLTDGQDDSVTGAATWYSDVDGDGFGDAASSTTACSAPPNYVSNSADCDDADGSTGDSVTWYADADGDGYGDASSTVEACAAPVGYVSGSRDCDDADGTIGDCAAAIACGSGFYCLDLSGQVNRDHTNGPFTDNASESWDVTPGLQRWLVADGSSVDFVIIDPDANGGASVALTKGGESWRPSDTFPESFSFLGGGASGGTIYVAGLASGWGGPSYAGVAATLTINFEPAVKTAQIADRRSRARTAPTSCRSATNLLPPPLRPPEGSRWSA